MNGARSYARFFIEPEVTDWFCWFWIANTGWSNSTSCTNLKKIGQKLRPWECRKDKRTNGRHDVIDFEISKSENKDLANICQIILGNFIKIDPSVWAASLPHTQKHTHTQTHTYIHTPSVPSLHIQSNWLNIKIVKMGCAHLRRVCALTGIFQFEIKCWRPLI